MTYLKTPEPSTLPPLAPRKLRPSKTLNGRQLPAHIYKRDLSGTSLQGVDGHDVIFELVSGSETLFDNSNLTGSRWVDCKLLQSAFIGADLTDTYAAMSRFSGSNFMHANLTNARFDHYVTFDFVIFDRAIMHGASITQAAFASFAHVEGEGMYFVTANLAGADFTGANLAGGDFSDAIVRGANFTDADLDAVKITAGQLATAVGWETARNLDPGLIAETLAIIEARDLGR